VKVKVKMRIIGLRQKALALAAGIGITFSLAAIVAPPASASDTIPCSGYCDVFNTAYPPQVYLWDSDNILLDETNSSIGFAFLNETTWDGRDVYEMYEKTTAKCITWSDSESDNYFSLSDCTPGNAEQEFFYNADGYLVSVGATGYFGPFSCMASNPSGDGPKAVVCSTFPTDRLIWNLI
jgi:hypothetical protein